MSDHSRTILYTADGEDVAGSKITIVATVRGVAHFMAELLERLTKEAGVPYELALQVSLRGALLGADLWAEIEEQVSAEAPEEAQWAIYDGVDIPESVYNYLDDFVEALDNALGDDDDDDDEADADDERDVA